MPGAGSQAAVHCLDVTALRVMVIFNFGLIIDSLLIPERVKIDFRKYKWSAASVLDHAKSST
jgi:hypothetical protein